MGYPNPIGFYRDGAFRRNVKAISSAATTFTPPIEESGFWYTMNTQTTIVVQLPKASSKWLGLEYVFVVEEQASSDDVKINTANDSSAVIHAPFSSIVDNHTTIIPGSTFFTAGRLTAVSSIRWVLEQVTDAGYPGLSSAATDNIGGWTTG